MPYTQYGGTTFVVAVVRFTTLSAEAMLDDLRAVSTRLIPGRQPDVRVMRDLMASTLTAPRFRAMLIGTFAVAATMRAAVGLYAAVIRGRWRSFANSAGAMALEMTLAEGIDDSTLQKTPRQPTRIVRPVRSVSEAPRVRVRMHRVRAASITKVHRRGGASEVRAE